MFDTILVEKRGQVGRITLNRPEALNACNDTMGRELLTVLKEMEADAEVKSKKDFLGFRLTDLSVNSTVFVTARITGFLSQFLLWL